MSRSFQVAMISVISVLLGRRAPVSMELQNPEFNAAYQIFIKVP